MEPTPKSEGVEKLLTLLTGKRRPDIIRANRCMTCDGEALEFTDALSEREYAISGMCQKCQDATF